MTRWHLINLPIWIGTERQPISRIDDVLVDFPAPRATGVLARARFRTAWIPFGEGVRVTPYGIRLDSRRRIAYETRRWGLTRRLKTRAWMKAEVEDAAGRLIGVVRDLEFSGERPVFSGLVISRGFTADLWSGALYVPAEAITVTGEGRIKIAVHGETGLRIP